MSIALGFTPQSIKTNIFSLIDCKQVLGAVVDRVGSKGSCVFKGSLNNFTLACKLQRQIEKSARTNFDLLTRFNDLDELTLSLLTLQPLDIYDGYSYSAVVLKSLA